MLIIESTHTHTHTMHLGLSYTLVINMQTLVPCSLCVFFFFLWSCGEKRRVGELGFLFPSELISSIKHQSQLMRISLSPLRSRWKTLFIGWQDVIARGTHKTRQSSRSSALLYLRARVSNYSFPDCFAGKYVDQKTLHLYRDPLTHT